MSILSYPQSAVIDEVILRKTPAGRPRAYLHVKENADPQALQNIVDYCHDNKWQIVPTSENGKPELEIRGFRLNSKFIGELQNKKWITGNGSVTEEPGDKIGFREKMSNHTLFMTSVLYFLGDYKFFKYGLKEANKLDMAAGIAYGAGTMDNFLFGTNPLLGRPDRSDMEVEDMSQRMADYMNAQNIKIPEKASINHILEAHNKGLLKKADDWMRHYPVEMMNGLFGVAGMCVSVAAYRKLHNHPVTHEMIEQNVAKKIGALGKHLSPSSFKPADLKLMREQSAKTLKKVSDISNKLDIGLGSLTVSAGVVANVVEEKKPDPDQPPKEGLAAIPEWLHQHPLMPVGMLLGMATMCHGVSTAMAYKVGTTDAKSAIFDRGIFVATNLMAELLMAISSKGHGSGVVSDKSVDNTILSLAAEMIAKEPPEQQAKLVECVSDFLGRPEALAMKDTEVKEILQHKIEALRNNPWAMLEKSEPAKENSLAAAQKFKGDMPAWQAKMTKEKAANPQPQLNV